jgi:hypothetical protein
MDQNIEAASPHRILVDLLQPKLLWEGAWRDQPGLEWNGQAASPSSSVTSLNHSCNDLRRYHLVRRDDAEFCFTRGKDRARN